MNDGWSYEKGDILREQLESGSGFQSVIYTQMTMGQAASFREKWRAQRFDVPAEDPNTGKRYKKKPLLVYLRSSDECWAYCPFHWYNPFDWFRPKAR